MANVTLNPRLEVLRQWKAAAAREGLTVKQWLVAAAELALARGTTR